MKAIIVGATSGIAREVASQLAAEGWSLCLVGRNKSKLESLASHLRISFRVDVRAVVQDFLDFPRVRPLVADLWGEAQGFELALVAQGSLPQKPCPEMDWPSLSAPLEINFLSPVSWIDPLADLMAKRGRGTILVLGSVAGDRGRQSNYLYGSAKAALAVYAQGLRHRLAGSGVNLITIKPGFVSTAMTANMKQGMLFVSASATATGILAAAKRSAASAYVPSFWRWIMLAIRLMPTWLIERTKL